MRDAGRYRDRLMHVRGLDHHETADHFLGFEERTLADDRLAVVHRNRTGCRRHFDREIGDEFGARCQGRRMRNSVGEYCMGLSSVSVAS